MVILRLAQVLAVAALLSSPAAAQPLPDKPFAEHHLVMQLSDNTQDKQLLVLSVAYNLLKTYDPDKIASDLERIRRFYLKNGYADFHVVGSDAQFDPEQGGYIVTITVEDRQVAVL